LYDWLLEVFVFEGLFPFQGHRVEAYWMNYINSVTIQFVMENNCQIISGATCKNALISYQTDKQHTIALAACGE
jgi:hypothetical protein